MFIPLQKTAYGKSLRTFLIVFLIAFMVLASFTPIISAPHYAHAQQSAPPVNSPGGPTAEEAMRLAQDIAPDRGEATCEADGAWYTKLNPSCWIPLAILSISEAIFGLAGWFSAFGGLVMDLSIDFTRSSANYGNATVDAAWTIVRDLVNMAFIFIILYIAFMTIMQFSGFRTKQILAKLIVVAVLLNFSFFLTSFFIDIGNVLGSFFYNAATPNLAQGQTISNTLSANLDVASIFENSGEDAGSKGVSAWNKAFGNIMSALTLVVAGFVFLSAGMLFIGRTISLIFILVLSPAAFVAAVLPNTKKYFDQWLGRLVSNTISLPIYTFLILLVIIFTQSDILCDALTGGSCGDQTLSQALSSERNPAGAVGIMIAYMIIIGFLMFAHQSTKKFSDGVTAGVGKWSGRALGWGAAGGAWFGRNYFGRRASERLARKGADWREMRDSGNVLQRNYAKLRLGSNNLKSNASFDVRAGAVGTAVGSVTGAAGIKGIGKAGGKGGYQKVFDAKAKEEKKELDRIPEDAVAETRQKMKEDRRKDGGGIAVDRANIKLAEAQSKLAEHQKAGEGLGGMKKLAHDEKTIELKKDVTKIEQRRDKYIQRNKDAQIEFAEKQENLTTEARQKGKPHVDLSTSEKRIRAARNRKKQRHIERIVRRRWNILRSHDAMAAELTNDLGKSKKNKQRSRLFSVLGESMSKKDAGESADTIDEILDDDDKKT